MRGRWSRYPNTGFKKPRCNGSRNCSNASGTSLFDCTRTSTELDYANDSGGTLICARNDDPADDLFDFVIRVADGLSGFVEIGNPRPGSKFIASRIPSTVLKISRRTGSDLTTMRSPAGNGSWCSNSVP